MKDILTKIARLDPAKASIEYVEGQYEDHLPVPATSVQSISTNYVFNNFKECAALFKRMLCSVVQDSKVLQKFEQQMNMFENDKISKIMTYIDEDREDFNSTLFMFLAQNIRSASSQDISKYLNKDLIGQNGEQIDFTFKQEIAQFRKLQPELNTCVTKNRGEHTKITDFIDQQMKLFEDELQADDILKALVQKHKNFV